MEKIFLITNEQGRTNTFSLKNLNLYIAALLLLTVNITGANAQGPEEANINFTNTQPTPPSPTASSLGKYGEYPVNYSSGLPSISIPLLEVAGTSMSIPISLSYHGGGQRVNDVASWVGLGWSLSAGGTISRTVFGHEDGASTGIKAVYNSYLGFNPDTFNPEGNADDLIIFNSIAKHGWTADPDIYSFNFLGYSGQFYIDLTGKIQLFSYQDLEINIDQGAGFIEKFTINTGDGVEFEFSVKESTTKTNSTNCAIEESGESFISAWHLTKVTTKFEVFTLTYLTETVNYEMQIETSETKPLSAATINIGAQNTCNSYNTLSIETQKLNTITGPFGTAIFTSNKSRTNKDLYGGTALETISYLNQTVAFQSDFSSTNRLKLDEVLLSVNNEQYQNYTFEYFPIDLPQVGSYKIDHWGYFNNKPNQQLQPAIEPYWPIGADRNPDSEFNQAGQLVKITYPTGGSTEFEWETNQRILYNVPEIEYLEKNKNLNDEVVDSHESKTINFVSGINQIIEISYSVGQNGVVGEPGDIDISGIPGISDNVNGSGKLTSDLLAPGDYTLQIFNNGIPFNDLSIHFKYIEKATIISENSLQLLGGQRIKSIRNYEDDLLLTQKSFEYPEVSISNAINEFKYQSSRTYYSTIQGRVDLSGAKTDVIRNSSSRFAVANSVSYEKVIEYNGTVLENLGKTEYFYHTNQDNGGGLFGTPKNNQSWKRSILKEKRVFDLTGKLVQKSINNYEFVSKDVFAGLRASYIIDDPVQEGFPLSNLDQISWRFYDRKSDWAKLISTKNTLFTSTGEITNTTNYEYFHADYHVNPNKITVYNSEGDSLTKIALFPKDYINTDVVFDNLKTNYFNQPIEIVSFKGDKNKILTGSLNEFDQFGNIIKQRKLDFEVPINANSFLFSNSSSQPAIIGNFNISSDYGANPEVEIDYLSNNRTKEVRTKYGVSSYLWGYNNNFLIAKINNATYSQIEAVLGGAGFALESNDGNHLSKSQEQSLRNNLPKSLVTTFTYNPEIGLLTSTDPQGFTTFYEYDEFNRLKFIKDKDGNVVKNFEYHYKEATQN